MKKQKKKKNEVVDDGERQEVVEDEEEKKKLRKNKEKNIEVVEEEEEKQKEVEEEEGKNREVVEQEEEKINEVDEEKQELHEVFNATGDDGIKIINADTFPVHLHPNSNVESIIRSVLGRPFVKFRDILKRNQLEVFFIRNSYFGHFLYLTIDPLPRFQMTIVYELLKRRFIFENPNKKDEILINYCGMLVFFGIRDLP